MSCQEEQQEEIETIGELIENFVGDLVDGTYSNGSDERMYAQQWFERCWFGIFPEPTLLNHLLCWGYDPEDYLNAMDNIKTAKEEKKYLEEHPEEADEEEASYLDDDIADWEEELKSVDKQERIQLAQTLGLEKWIDSDGYLSEDYYKDKTDLELSEMGVAPLIHTIDLNSEVMTLSVTKYQKVSYGNTVVGYFEVDGYPSLCCEHDRRTPEAGSSTGSWEEITDANLRTVMYYGYTGPGNIFSDYNKGCVGTSLALSYYVRGLSSTGMGGPHSAGAERVGMSQLIYKAEQKASVPSGFKVYRVTTNGGSTQRLMFSIYNPKTYTSLTVQKTWNDQNNKYNLRPSSVKINLYRWSNKDSTRVLIGSANIAPSNNEWNWKVTWNNLIRTDGDTIYDYTAQEEAVPGYTGKMSWEGSYEKGWVGKLTNTLQTGSVNLQKTSSVPDVTNGNDCYSLKGAEYGVYSDSSLSGASKVGVLTTDENGESNTLTLNAGTYYVRETTAPKGYALDKTTYTVTIKPNETYKLKVSDKPTLDPVGVLLGKVDKETNQNKPEGSLSLEGALFTAKFYAGVQSDSDPAVEGKTADRTWIFRTNEDGFCYYEEKYLESGDELYLSPTKNPSLPIGTLTIQETKAPEGYLINPEVYTVKITSNNNGSEFVYTYNQPTIPEQSLDLNIVKKEKGKEYAIEGAVFEHVKPDGTTETVTTDANGVCKFKTLGYGQHKIREVSVPDEYTVNEGVVTFTVAKDNSITLDSNTATDESMKFQVEANGTASLGVEDTLAPYQLKVTKLNEKEKALENAEFTIYEDKDCTKEISKIVTDDTGVATTDPLVVEKKYYVKETKAPQGYRIPKDVNGNDYVYEIYTKYNDKRQYEYYVNGEVHTKDSGDHAIEGTPHERIVNLKIENRTGLQMPETGTHTTLLIVLLGVACMSVGIVHQFKKGRRKGNEKNDKI